MLINRLLLAFGRRHFESRQWPDAPECWHHFSVFSWPEVHTIACKQVWAKNYSRTKLHYLVNIQPYQFEPERTLQEEDDSKWLRYWCSRATIIHVSLESVHVTSGHFSFLFFAFESGFQCSHNGGHPVIWIISLYIWYQVYFVIIIVDFLVSVLRITFF